MIAANKRFKPVPSPQTKQPCYGRNSLRDKEVRFFSLLRLGQTFEEWILGGASKLLWFGAAKAGAKAAGGAESLGAAFLGTAGKGLGYAGSALVLEATASDASCQTEGASNLLFAPLEPVVVPHF